MSDYIFAGCDLHDKNMQLRIALNDGEGEAKVFGADREGRERMIRYLRWRSGERGGAKIIFAYEASGSGYGLYDDLSEAGIVCWVLAPTRLDRSVKRRKKKTNDKDAQRVLEVIRGHVLAGNELPEVWVPDRELRDDRELVRGRLDVSQKGSGVRAQIKSLLKRNEMRRPEGLGKGWTWEYKGWLGELTREGSGLGAGGRTALLSLLRQLDMLEQEKERLDGEVERLSEGERYRGSVEELRKLKGVGLLTAMVFLTEMGDLGRFRNRRQVGDYMGLAPSSDESGEETDRKGHITHQGPWRVRWVLCQAYWSRSRTDKQEKEWYEGVVRRNPKHKKIAVVGGMRRLGIKMWHRARVAQGIESPLRVAPVGESASVGPRREVAGEKTRARKSVRSRTPAHAMGQPG